MSDADIEALVERFLEQREFDRDLTPERFAVLERPDDPRLLAALRAALDAEARLREIAEPAVDRVGPYRVVRTLGRGGMGVVHEVERDGRRFALKRLHPAAADDRARERFRREARLLARLDHPGIVRVVELIDEPGELALVLELVRGVRASDAPRGADLRATLRIAIELADAVAAVHDAGLLHRDLKPQNVLLRDDGRCVLVDFGLGASDDDRGALTSTGDLLGTPRYMAPEQALGRTADARTDVWGLGQIVFELVTGRAAIDEGSRPQVLRAVIEGRVHRAREFVRDLPRDLERVLQVALARTPRRRYASAREFGDDLRRIAAGERALARPPGLFANGIDAARAHPARAAACLLACIAIAAAGVWSAVRWRAENAARLALADRHLERALIAWTAGESAAAVRELDVATRLSPSPATRALADVLAGRETEGGAWSIGLSALQRGDATLAATSLEPIAATEALALALRARSLRLARRLEPAERCLEELERRAPMSTLAALERAALLESRDERAAAIAELGRAARLDDGDPRVGRELARALLDFGDHAEGIRVAREAIGISARAGQAGPTELARFLRRAQDLAALREALEQRLARDPGEGDSRFALAFLLDADHLVRQASLAYRALLEREPDHGWALAYLSHLRSGADVGRCADCDRAFGADASMIDRDEACELLTRAVLADAGRDAALLNTIVYLARDHRMTDEVCDALEDALEADVPPARRARLSDALLGLRRGVER